MKYIRYTDRLRARRLRLELIKKVALTVAVVIMLYAIHEATGLRLEID